MNSLHKDFPSEEKEHFVDIIVLEGVIIPWMLPELNDGSYYVFPPETGRAVRVLSRTSGITWQAGDRLLFQHRYTPAGATFVQFG